MAKNLQAGLRQSMKASREAGLTGDGVFSRAPLDLRFAMQKTLDPRVTFTRASSGTYVGSDGLLKTAATNEPRFDHNPTTGESLGLMGEEARTNSVRNNTGVGAVAGTPGTLPTYSSYFANGGLTTSVIGTGTENGINYVDIRLNGTTATTFLVYAFDNAAASASAGQAWTESFWVSIVGGSAANISTISVNLRQSGGSSTVFDTPFTPSASLTRVSGAATLGTGATGVTAALAMSFSAGVAIDITIRIGLPQLEQGAFATSVIPTTSATVTRAADVASITGSNFSSWYNQNSGTVYAEYRIPALALGTISSFDDGTANNRWQQRYTATALRHRFVATGSTIDDTDTALVPSISILNKAAYATTVADQRYAGNGTLNNTARTQPAMPVVTQLQLGVGVASDTSGQIRISRLTYWPTRLANTTLQQITQS
jgi:hypothetical protein